ncbi:MAG: xanthine dehydrogenase molybdopterin binding subunit [Candidatus Cloacimonetes bacterium]|nr:xanthine dehydrogenase molybdopterin binding subunit [Candidatus Cloacimonadota bacterium]
MSDKEISGVGAYVVHDSAHKHVTGEAVYTDDLPELPNCLHTWVVTSPHAHAKIKSINIKRAESFEGVEAVLSAKDILGTNDVGPIFPNEPVLAEELVEYVGQPVVIIAAQTRELAREASHLVKVEYEILTPILDVREALEKKHFVAEPHSLQIGDSKKALANAANRLQGEIDLGGQDHFYLEGQICVAHPLEDDDMKVYSSTQHPAEVQKMVARFLNLAKHSVVVEVRRMGGGFGGKETQPANIACMAALLANKTKKSVKLRLGRDEDMIITGKRHDFYFTYDVGYTNEGEITGIELNLASKCGHVADLSTSILDRALFFSDSVYYLKDATINGFPCKTHTVSNTAFRGFGGPQGSFIIEEVIDVISNKLKKNPHEVRKLNYYGTEDRNVTPYHQTIEDNIIHEITDQLEVSSDYQKRYDEIREYNKNNKYYKKGISFVPTKFGVSFTTAFLNQAGALIHIYADGSIHLNHGGTEMGQGLFTKVAQVVASEFQVDLSRVKITATTTEKVPNTSATAASSGSDLNGMAAQNGAQKLKRRLIKFAAEKYEVDQSSVTFKNNMVYAGDNEISFNALVGEAYFARVSLSATGFYKTPKIYYDRSTSKGRPFFYYTYGACVAEVLLDTLTGECKVTRADILHDVGASLSPNIDMGQIEGGFVQGMGWLTNEELKWDDKGSLRTHAPSTYKIPVSRDIPDVFNVEILKNHKCKEETIYSSKAVGEPPFMHGMAVWHAIKDAIKSHGNYEKEVKLNAPATPEEILRALDSM